MLRTALAASRETGVARHAPPPLVTPDIARRLVERYGGTGPRKTANALEALLQRLRLVRFDWDEVAPADRLDVVWVLWTGAVPPAEHEAFLDRFLQWIETPFLRRLQATRLAAMWTAAFDPTLKSIGIVGVWLQRHAAALPDPWAKLAATYDIFSLENGPVALADKFLGGTEKASRFFERLQLPAGAVAGGLGLEMLAAAAARVEQRLAETPRLAARLCDLSCRDGAFRPDAPFGRAPRRAAIRRAIAEALLLPWRDETPPPSVKTSIRAFLLRHYDDARVRPEPWAKLRAPAATIMRAWLIEAAVAAYFQLADRARSADRLERGERKEFWTTHLDHIDDAWLLSGRSDAAGADQPAHGLLVGCRAGQAALLLRVGGAIILEATDAPSERVWYCSNPLAPMLYRGTAEPYWPAAFASGFDFCSAHGKGHESWQKRLARFIGIDRATPPSRGRLAVAPLGGGTRRAQHLRERVRRLESLEP